MSRLRLEEILILVWKNQLFMQLWYCNSVYYHLTMHSWQWLHRQLHVASQSPYSQGSFADDPWIRVSFSHPCQLERNAGIWIPLNFKHATVHAIPLLRYSILLMVTRSVRFKVRSCLRISFRSISSTFWCLQKRLGHNTVPWHFDAQSLAQLHGWL